MRLIRYLLSAVVLSGSIFGPSIHAAEPQDRQPLTELIAAVLKMRRDEYGGISAEKEKVAKQILDYRGQAAAPMLQLLQSNEVGVREFAGYVVRDLEGFTENDLGAIIAAARAGNGWVPPAIARIGTPRAVEFLIGEFKKKPDFGTQYTYALTLLGEKAVPDLVELVRTLPPPSWPNEDAIEEILSDQRGAGAAAVPGLRAIVRDVHIETAKRLRAIFILGSIGPNAIDAVGDLKAVADSNRTEFSDEVKRALTKIGTTDALPPLLRELSAHPNGYTLSSIASLGTNGRNAGAAVRDCLGSKDWDLRVDAVRTLGYIGDVDATPALLSLLDDKDNWKLVYVAAESLGRLRAQSAVPTLETTAQLHWFPPVRVAASRALRSVRGENVYKPQRPGASYWEMLMDFTNEGVTPRIASYGSGKRRFVVERGAMTKSELERLTYESPAMDPNVNAPNRVRMEKVTPNRGVRFGNACLLGSDFGEFGGELGYRNERGHTSTIIRSNVHGIHQMSFGVIVTTGLAHLGLNFGTAWLVELKPGEPPTAKPFKLLPGAPRESGLLENGDLFISCAGGDVIITRTGEIRMADA